MSKKHTKYFGGWKLTLGITIVLILLVFLVSYAPMIFSVADTNSSENNKIKIGVILPLDGDFSTFGIEYMRGIELATEKLNAMSETLLLGLVSYNYTPVYINSSGVSENALRAFSTFYDEGIKYIIGPVTSDAALSLAPYAEMLGEVMISPSASQSDLREYNNYVFSLFPSDNYIGNGIASIAGSICKDQYNSEKIKIAVLYTGNSMYESGLRNEFEKGINEYSEYCSPTYISLLDIDDAVSKIKDLDPALVVFFALHGSQAHDVLISAENAGLRNDIIWITTTEAMLTDPSTLTAYNDRMYCLTPTVTITDQSYVERYEEKYGPMITPFSIYGYDTMMIYGLTINSGYTNTDSLAQKLKELRYIGLTGMIAFDESGARYPTIDVMTLRNGKWKYEDWYSLLSFEETHHSDEEE